MSSASCLYTSGHKELKSPLQLGRLSKINHVSIAAKWLSPYAEILQGQMMIEWRKSWALFGLRRKGLKLGELGLAFDPVARAAKHAAKGRYVAELRRIKGELKLEPSVPSALVERMPSRGNLVAASLQEGHFAKRLTLSQVWTGRPTIE